MRFTPISAVLAIVIASGANAEPQFTIIDPEKARSIEELCSRSSPGPVQRYWLPREAEVRSAEELLPAYVARLERPTTPVSEYYRQYIGIVVADRPLLYVNLFHRSHFEMWEFVRGHVSGEAFPPRDMWLREVVDVCDGGGHYWGVVFDPADALRVARGARPHGAAGRPRAARAVGRVGAVALHGVELGARLGVRAPTGPLTSRAQALPGRRERV